MAQLSKTLLLQGLYDKTTLKNKTEMISLLWETDDRCKEWDNPSYFIIYPRKTALIFFFFLILVFFF